MAAAEGLVRLSSCWSRSASPGHAADHVCFSRDDVTFCGDLILGHGSSIVPPRAMGGSLAEYMDSLERLAALGPALMCPGHGPWITDPAAATSAS